MNIMMGIILLGCAGLIFVGLVAGAVVLVIYLRRHSDSPMPANPPAGGVPAAISPAEPLSIAQQRYASGAISREEYQQLVDDLTKK